jgi:hypothetical protein
VLNGSPGSIAVSLTVALLGVLMGTIAVVGFFLVTVPWSFRILYGVLALTLLTQPAMFEGAGWLNVVGVAGTVLALGHEVWRGRGARHMHRPHGSAALP